MIEAVCLHTCAPGIEFYKEGRSYLVDENDPFIKRHFEIPAPVNTEAAMETPIPSKPKRGKRAE